MTASGLWIVEGGLCRTRLAYVHTNLQDDKGTRAQEHTRGGDRGVREGDGWWGWLGCCVSHIWATPAWSTRKLRVLQITQLRQRLEWGIILAASWLDIAHTVRLVRAGGSAGGGGFVFGFCLFAQRAGSCNNNSGRTHRTANPFPFPRLLCLFALLLLLFLFLSSLSHLFVMCPLMAFAQFLATLLIDWVTPYLID